MASQNKPDTAEAEGKRNNVLTLRQRIKDKHVKCLRALAFETNQVWNYCNEFS